MKPLDFSSGLLLFPLAVESDGGGFYGVPLSAERLNNGRNNQTLDIRAGGIVSTKLVPLDGIEGAFQQGAEDGRFNIAPVGFRGFDEQVKLVFGQG